MWTDKFDKNKLEAWLLSLGNRIKTGNKDPFSSSMRNTRRFISALTGNAESRESQQLTDLSSAQLYNREQGEIGSLGKRLIFLCEKYNIADNDELSTCLLLFLEAIKQQNEFYLSITRFWHKLSFICPLSYLSENVAMSYMLSYLSVTNEKLGYTPLDDLFDTDGTFAGKMQVTDIKSISLSTEAISKVDSLIEAINGYTSRSSRTEMLQSLDIIFSFDKECTIDRICDPQRNSAQNDKLKRIIRDNKYCFSFSSLLYGINYDKSVTDSSVITFKKYLNAIRTKPFLLLAGISGTGKSRIVRELAFKSCPKYLQDKDGTTPGNYCMIEVKPNWHDSTELLGYYSNLNKGYQFKKFVQFLVKAKMNPEIPFFVCLDEMNLAPVEQYFAEILSILETRKHPKNEAGEVDMSIIKTGVIVEGKYFKELTRKNEDGSVSTKLNMSDKDWYEAFFNVDDSSVMEKEQVNKYQYSRTLQTEGLTLPDNVVIIGTVNMDDTTHQFSRKVIDRAMTIEMNGGKLKNMFGGSNNLAYLEEEEQKKWQAAFKQEYVSADEVLAAHPNEADKIVEMLPEKLEAINAALKGTPFEVSYRVLNELTIMVGVMLDDAPGEELEKIVDNALDRILLMKILPRIEGDSDMFNLKTAQTVGGVTCHNRLEWLRELAPSINYSEEEGKDHQQTAKEKIEEMIERLENQEFTRFWP